MSDPQLVAKSQAQDPAGPWEQRTAFQSLTIATGADHTNSAGRAIVSNGQVVRTETGGATIGSTSAANASQNAAARMPYDYAIDAGTRCEIAPHQLQEDSIVYFGESSMTIAQARQVGFLPPGWQRPGTYSDEVFAQRQERADNNRPFESPAAPTREELVPELKSEGFANHAAEQELTSIVDNTGGLEQMNAIKEIIETGQVSERTRAELATQLAIEPGALSEKFAPVMAEYERQGRAVFSAGGLDADEVIAWSQQNRPDALNLAMRKQATQRSTAGYAALRNEFLANLGESNPERALSADLGQGITSYRDDKGRVVVRLSSGETMLWKAAIQSFGIRNN